MGVRLGGGGGGRGEGGKGVRGGWGGRVFSLKCIQYTVHPPSTLWNK